MRFLQDVRYSLRTLRQSKVFAVAILGTLALGIGANTAVFSILNPLLLKPYPYRDPERIVVLESLKPQGGAQSRVSYADYADLREHSRSFAEMAAVQPETLTLTQDGETVLVKGAYASASLFHLLGGKPVLGRTFSPAEDSPGGPKVIVLSEALWRSRFAADPKTLGRHLEVNGQSHLVIGIIPHSAQFPDTDAAKAFVPIALSPLQEPRQNRFYHVLGRLKPGITPEQARSEVDALARQLAQAHPDTNDGWTFSVLPLREFRTRNFREIFVILFAVVGFVLLIACANAANLLLQRATVRDRELAIRTALGAGKGRVIRQLLTESLLLALIAGGLGLLLAQALLRLVVANLTLELPSYMNQFRVDGRVFLFMLAVSLLTAILFGLVPALSAAKPQVTEALKEGGARTGSVRKRRLRNALMVSEVALSMMLLAGAGLMLKSFQRLQQADPGFDPGNVLTLELALPEGDYPEPRQRMAFAQQLVERLQGLPGVRSASSGSSLPVGNWPGSGFRLADRAPRPEERDVYLPFQLVSPGYFETLEVPVQRGRVFTAQDDADAVRVAVVNAALATRLWSGEDPIGRRIQLPDLDEKEWWTVVGVVGDTKHQGLRRPVAGAIYLPHRQTGGRRVTLFLRTQGDPLSIAGAVRSEVRALDPRLPVEDIKTLRQVLLDSLWLPRLSTFLFGLFAVVALLLAISGVYGTVAYNVAHRTQEIGVRMALGAQLSDVSLLVLRQGLRLVAIGLAVGAFGALGLMRVLSKLLYQVSGFDPSVIVGCALMLVLAAILACYVPARRAARVDPIMALHYE